MERRTRMKRMDGLAVASQCANLEAVASQCANLETVASQCVNLEGHPLKVGLFWFDKAKRLFEVLCGTFCERSYKATRKKSHLAACPHPPPPNPPPAVTCGWGAKD